MRGHKRKDGKDDKSTDDRHSTGAPRKYVVPVCMAGDSLPNREDGDLPAGDEPAAGVPEGESDELFEVLGALSKDISILLIEHDMSLVFRFADRITVLVSGAELVTGTPAEIAADPRVREVYLGKRH